MTPTRRKLPYLLFVFVRKSLCWLSQQTCVDDRCRFGSISGSSLEFLVGHPLCRVWRGDRGCLGFILSSLGFTHIHCQRKRHGLVTWQLPHNIYIRSSLALGVYRTVNISVGFPNWPVTSCDLCPIASCDLWPPVWVVWWMWRSPPRRLVRRSLLRTNCLLPSSIEISCKHTGEWRSAANTQGNDALIRLLLKAFWN